MDKTKDLLRIGETYEICLPFYMGNNYMQQWIAGTYLLIDFDPFTKEGYVAPSTYTPGQEIPDNHRIGPLPLVWLDGYSLSRTEHDPRIGNLKKRQKNPFWDYEFEYGPFTHIAYVVYGDELPF